MKQQLSRKTLKEGINDTENTKSRHEWTNLKKIQTDRNCGLLKTC